MRHVTVRCVRHSKGTLPTTMDAATTVNTSAESYHMFDLLTDIRLSGLESAVSSEGRRLNRPNRARPGDAGPGSGRAGRSALALSLTADEGSRAALFISS